ncbi:MAG: MFS transporter [Thermoplasmata archaeon]
MGNAFFTSTAISILVRLSAGRISESMFIYEAALGLGIVSGPLFGGLHGSFSWRYPFLGTSMLMAIGFLLRYAFVHEPPNKEKKRTLLEIIEALRNKLVRINALVALDYNFGFFTILAFTPLMKDVCMRSITKKVLVVPWALESKQKELDYRAIYKSYFSDIGFQEVLFLEHDDRDPELTRKFSMVDVI